MYSVFDRLSDHTDSLDDQELQNLILGIFDAADHVEDLGEIRFDFQNIDTKAMLIAHETLKKVQKEKRFDLISKILNVQEIYFSCALLIFHLNKEFEDSKGRNSGESPTLTGDEVNNLKSVFIKKIKEQAKNGSLANSKNLPYFLYRWKEWGLEKEVRKYVKELSQTDEGLLILLEKFESVSTETSNEGTKNDQESRQRVNRTT